MMDPNEKYWSDLVEKLKKELTAMGLAPTMTTATAFHNRISEAISEAFRRGQSVPRK